MSIDLELYRREVTVTRQPPVRLSVIDIAPEYPRHTIIFVHGFGGRAVQWRYQLLHFSPVDRVIALDLRGHGRSDQPARGYGMPQQVEDLKTALDALQVTGPVVLVGHSFGGAICSEYAAAYPERVERLVLIATAAEFQLSWLFRALLNLPSPVMFGLSRLTRGWLGAPPHILQALYFYNLYGWRGWDLFRRLQLPTLVIRGHQDFVFRSHVYDAVAQTIAGAEEVDVGASGHMVMLERREAVNRAIERFLESAGPSWRETPSHRDDQQETDLLRQRPWLARYGDVPYSVAVPPVPLYHLLWSAARRFPNRTALDYEGSRATYRQLYDLAGRFAAALQHRGLGPGGRVMLALPNLPQLVIAFYGTLMAGAAAVFAPPTASSENLVRMIKDSSARVLVTITEQDDLITRVQAQLTAQNEPLDHVVFVHLADALPLFKRLLLSPAERVRHRLDLRLGPGMHLFQDWLDEPGQAFQDAVISPQQMAALLYTGGTTETPRGVMLSHRNLIANAFQARHWLSDAEDGKERCLSVLPFSHSYGLTAALNTPLALAATLILKSRFEPLDILKTIQAQRPTFFPGTPEMFVALKDMPGVRRYGLELIKVCLSGAEPLPVEVLEAFEKQTRGRLVESYGLTEATAITHANPIGGLYKPGSIGLPVPSTEARLMDLHHPRRSAKQGQVGELAVRGPQVMLGYWNDPRATRQALAPDGWLLTGDVAQLHEDGYFRMVARKADLWYPDRPGGPLIPRDVEEVLFEVPQVKEAAVVVTAGRLVAFVIPRQPRPSADSLIAYCKRRLPPEMVPRLVVFVDDFPRSFIGKVLRRELASRLRPGPGMETDPA